MQHQERVILLVDDEPAMLRMYRRRLNALFVVGLGSVRSVGEWVDGGGLPYAVLTDFHLPDGTGLDVMRRVKKASSIARCYVVSAHADDVPEEAKALAIHVLAKDSPSLARLCHELNVCAAQDQRVLVDRMRDVAFNSAVLPDNESMLNWYQLARIEGAEHPVVLEFWRRLRDAEVVYERWQRSSDLIEAFQRALPRTYLATYLEADRLYRSMQEIESSMSYNIGVDHGRAMRVVESALCEHGVLADNVDVRVLYRLTAAIVRIARDLWALKS